MGIDPKDSTLPDSPEVREKRAQLEKDVAAIRAEGMVPDVGMEFPDIQGPDGSPIRPIGASGSGLMD